MARNKYPEETVEKILDVAERLLVERGYEQYAKSKKANGCISRRDGRRFMPSQKTCVRSSGG